MVEVDHMQGRKRLDGQYRKAELLAPAGSVEGFYGAVNGGADAVYLAGNRFGARAYAENFTTEQLLECIHYGHLFGCKLYLTVNTLLKDSELSELYDYLLPLYEAGMDAVIVQDFGVFGFIKKYFPGWKLHASTQMTICSSYGVSLLKSMGASRIVPARELSLRELTAIRQQNDIELETFIHGAMCYCYSGQCLFSSILGGRSGNRGRCAQPCRLPYSIHVDGAKLENCYPLSLKDMCTIEHIPQLIEAGIDSFKIEGRMKKPEYTAGVTSIYRRYIDKYCALRDEKEPQEAAKAYHIEKEDLDILSSLYIRSEIHDGYYFKRNGREMITLKSPSYSGNNDALLADIHTKYIAGKPKLPVNIMAVFEMGKQAEVTLYWHGISYTAKGMTVERAQKQPITEENVRKQLGRLGDSAFCAEEIQVDMASDAFYPLKQINELRREAVAGLERQILLASGYSGTMQSGVEYQKNRADGQSGAHTNEIFSTEELSGSNLQKGWVFSVCTLQQLEAITEWFGNTASGRDLVRVYVDGDLVLQEWETVSSLCGRLPVDCKIFAALPYIVRASDSRYLEQLYTKVVDSVFFHGFLVRSMDGLGFVRGKEKLIPYRTDAGVYIWNKSAMQELGRESEFPAEGFCLPYELNASEQRSLLGGSLDSGLLNRLSCEKIVYSRIPMMITANCLLCTMGKCMKEAKAKTSGSHAVLKDRYHAVLKDRYHAVLKDRYRRDFPVGVNCLHCMNIIYNSVPFSLHQKLPKWSKHVDLRMDFTFESASEVMRLLDSFLGDAPFPQDEYTTGHEKRGVE